jgi:hypothetical protein
MGGLHSVRRGATRISREFGTTPRLPSWSGPGAFWKTDSDGRRSSRAGKKTAQDRVDRPPRAGDTGTYNQFWFDRGTKVVHTRRTSLIVDPSDGKLPPLTAAGARREEERFKKLGPSATGSSGNGPFDSYEDISVVTRCITRGLPNAMFPGGYNNNYQIIQAPGLFVMLTHCQPNDEHTAVTPANKATFSSRRHFALCSSKCPKRILPAAR